MIEDFMMEQKCPSRLFLSMYLIRGLNLVCSSTKTLFLVNDFYIKWILAVIANSVDPRDPNFVVRNFNVGFGDTLEEDGQK